MTARFAMQLRTWSSAGEVLIGPECVIIGLRELLCDVYN